MSAARDAKSFVEAAQRIDRMGDLTALLSEAVRELGFDCVTMVHHVNLATPPAPAIAYSDYPLSFLETSFARRFFSDDPVLVACQRRAAPFAWSELPNLIAFNPRQAEILAAAKEAGLEQGFTVPINVPGEPLGSCSFGLRTGRQACDEANQAATWVAVFAFERARRILGFSFALGERPPLSPRQLDCVVLAGRGKSNWAIGHILGITHDTVAEHLAAARRRYGVATRQQLLACCLADGQLSYADVLG